MVYMNHVGAENNDRIRVPQSHHSLSRSMQAMIYCPLCTSIAPNAGFLAQLARWGRADREAITLQICRARGERALPATASRCSWVHEPMSRVACNQSTTERP